MSRICLDCPEEVVGKKRLCSDCASVRTQDQLRKKNEDARCSRHSCVDELSRRRKAGKLRADGYELPWLSSNGYE